jgi:hypothetical protein
MDLKTISDRPSWEWPAGAGTMLRAILRDAGAPASARLLAAEMAGDVTVIDDAMVDALLAIVQNDAESEELRGKAVLSLGPILEIADIDGFDAGAEALVGEEAFHRTQESLHTLYQDARVPAGIRRVILEASARAPEDWHHDAVRAAFASGDEAWRLTAVFCMGFVPGFDAQIIEALESKNPDIHYEAVCAAGSREVDAAWPHIAALVAAERTPKPLLLAAIEAVASIRPEYAPETLGDLADSDDEDIVAAVHEAIAMAGSDLDEDDEDEDDLGEDDEDEDDEDGKDDR